MKKQVKKQKRKSNPVSKEKDWKPEHDNVLNQLKTLKQKYDIQKIYSEKIEKRLNVLEKQVKQYKDDSKKQKDTERKEIMKDKEIVARDILIQQMQFELKKQKDLTNLYNEQVKRDQEFNTIISAGKVPVIMINKFSEKDIENSHREFNIKDKAVFFKEFNHNTNALKALIAFRPKLLLNPIQTKYLIEFKRKRIINVDITPDQHEFYGSVDLKQLQDSVNSAERKEFDDWLATYKSR